jgi:hypothetical protein
MKTGWRHNDHQTQREFERFRRASTVTTETSEATSTTAGGITTTTTGGGTTTIITNPPSSTFFELDAISPYQTCQVTVENTGTKAFLTIDRFLTVAVDGLDILTRLSQTFTNGISNTVKRINFISGSNVVLNGSNFADDEVTVTINASVTGGGGSGTMSSWYVRTNTDAAEQISDAETVTFINGKTTYWTRTGNDLVVQRPLTIKGDGAAVGDNDVTTINYDSSNNTGTQYIEWEVTDIGAGERRVRGKYTPQAPPAYYWQVRSGNDGVAAIAVNNSNIVTWNGTNGVYISRVGLQLNVDRPLQLQMNAINVGPSDTTVIDFRNATPTIPSNYTSQIYFDVVDWFGTRRIFGYYHSGGGGGGGSYDWIASNGVLTATVTSGETVTWLGANAVTVGFNTTTQTFTIDRPLQVQDDAVNVGDTATVTLNYDSNGATGTNYIEWEVADTGSGQRRIRGKYNPGASALYSWYLVATATPGSEEITNTEQAIFTGRNGISVTRVANQIFIEQDPTDPWTGTGTDKRLLTGELVFSNTAPDYIGTLPAYKYGTRQYVDIVHNWNLSNLNNFHLELVDRALDSTGTNVVYYRSGLNTMWGIPPLGNQSFRNIPHWAAVDRNTIRVWATMSRLKPTEMRFRYTLVEL